MNTPHSEWLANLPEPILDDLSDFDESAQSADDATPQAATAAPAHVGATVLAATAVAGATLLKTSPARAQSQRTLTYADIPGTGDAKVLNYALALEALEADLYRQAIARVTQLGVGSNELDLRYYRAFSAIETGHRDFLNGALGAASILRQAPFNRASFDFRINELSRLQVFELVLDVERTGVAAYLGALPSLRADNFKRIAAAIQGTEARHTTILFITFNRLRNAGVAGFTGQPIRNVAPVTQEITTPGGAGNDIQAQGREPTVSPTGGQPTITENPPFDPDPRTSATFDAVLAKVSPLIRFN